MGIRKTRVAGVTTVLALMGMAFTETAIADDKPVYEIEIRDHHFVPDSIEIPADTRVKLVIRNKDASAEEFESYELNREVIIAGNSEGTVFIGPLDEGTYPFFGEFNQATAQGRVIVKKSGN